MPAAGLEAVLCRVCGLGWRDSLAAAVCDQAFSRPGKEAASPIPAVDISPGSGVVVVRKQEKRQWEQQWRGN